MKEIWKNYEKSSVPNDNYEVFEVTVNSEGTKIILNGVKNTVSIKFCTVDSLRVSDEGRRIKTYHEVEGIQEYRENFYGNPIYQVENSEFASWVVEESAGFCTDMQHYAIVTLNDIVDVLDAFPPEIIVEEIVS